MSPAALERIHERMDPAKDLLAKRLHRILEGGKAPLVSVDLDDTLLPFGQIISKRELDTVIAYVQAGGEVNYPPAEPGALGFGPLKAASGR